MIEVFDTYVQSAFVHSRVVRRQRVVKLFGITIYRSNTEENE